MDHSLVSVIIPTFNRAYCIAATIDSALAQTHQDLEILIIDDGSTDGTARLIAERYGSEPRVKYHYKANGGPATAKNLGLQVSKGDFVAILDSDDVWFPWKLELQLALMRDRPEIGMVWTDMDAIDANLKVCSERHIRKMYHSWKQAPVEQMFTGMTTISALAGKFGGTLPAQIADGHVSSDVKCYTGDVFSPMIMGCLVHTSTVLLRRERALRVKEWNVDFRPTGEDYDFHLRTTKEGPVGFIDVPTIHYQVGNPDQLTRPAFRATTALNCLRTIVPLIKAGEGINIPAKTLKRRIADVHDWAADALFQSGQYAASRMHAIQSLKGYPWRPRRWKILAASCLPVPCIRYLKSLLPAMVAGLMVLFADSDLNWMA